MQQRDAHRWYEIAGLPCPSWCSGGHVPADEGLLHISIEKVVLTACGGERHEIYVSVERSDADGVSAPAAVRLESSTSTPMTPQQAMRLSSILASAAMAAITGGAQ